MLPSNILLKITNLMVEIHQKIDHSLLPKYRLDIYRIIIEELETVLALKVFGWLEFLTAQYITKIWDQEMPNDDFVPNMLRITKNLLLGIQTLDETSHERSMFYHAAGSEEYNEFISTKSRATMLAAYTALSTACGKFPFQYADIEQIERNFSDEILFGLNGSDTATFAVIAFSGFNLDYEYETNTNETNPDNEEVFEESPISKDPAILFEPKKRLEFWEWWLTEAIPQAWELANQSYQNRQNP